MSTKLTPLQKDDLWKIFTNKNPHWLTDGVTFTPAGLQKLFDVTFDKGHALGVVNGKAIANKRQAESKASSPLGGMFDDILGGRR